MAVNNPNIRVAVLGAYGQSGVLLVNELLCRTSVQVLAVGRNQAKLDALKSEQGNDDRLDLAIITDLSREQLKSVISDCELVVNCIGPYLESGLEIAETVAFLGVNYLDLASEQEHYRRLSDLHNLSMSRGTFVMTGAGAYPGISGILLKLMTNQYPDADSAHITLAMEAGGRKGPGIAAMMTGVLEVNYPLENLEGHRLCSGNPGLLISKKLPEPFGELDVSEWPQLEILVTEKLKLVSGVKTYIRFLGLPRPSQVQVRLLRMMQAHRIGVVYGLLKRLISWRLRQNSFRRTQNIRGGGILVEVGSSGNVNAGICATSDDPALSVALPVAVVVFLQRERLKFAGLITPMEVIEPEGVLETIENLGFSLKIHKLPSCEGG